MENALLPSTKFAVDNRASRLTVQAFASGLASVMAHCPTFAIREFTGEVSVSAPRPERGTCRLSIRASSLDIMDDVTRQDRQAIEKTMFQEVLEIAKFPEIVFEAPQVSLAKIGENMHRVSSVGSLSLHGVKSRQSVNCQAVIGEDTLRIYGDCTLLQTDFNITIASVAGGTLKLRNELRMAFFLIARKATTR